MVMVGEERRMYSWKEGLKTEDMFVASCEKIGYKAIKSSKSIDINKHIDFFIYRTDETITSVDVKGCNSPYMIWVEFKNVNGDKGWIYGEAEFIAFDMPELNGFCLVDREDLLSYCKDKVEPKFVEKHNAYKKLYQRNGRKDVITKLYLSDIQQCNSYKLIKYNDNTRTD